MWNKIKIITGILILVAFIYFGAVHLKCKHYWDTINEFVLIDQHKTRTGSRYILKCKHCGDVKKRDM